MKILGNMITFVLKIIAIKIWQPYHSKEPNLLFEYIKNDC